MNESYEGAQNSTDTNETPAQSANKMIHHTITNTNNDDPKEPLSSSTPNKSSPQNSPGEIQINNKNKIVILDWDDTMVPTSIISNSIPQTHITFDELKCFGNAIYDLLVEYIMQFGSENIYIVTNSAQWWVWESLQILTDDYQNYIDDCMTQNMMNKRKRPYLINYFAQIHNLLRYENIKSRIYSARNLYAKYYPNDSLKWKVLTFKDIITEHFRLNTRDIDCNEDFMIVSIGDGVDEFQASHIVQRMLMKEYKLKKVHLHRYKLVDCPTMDSMTKQAIMIRDRAEYISVCNNSETLRFRGRWDDPSRYIDDTMARGELMR